MVIIRPGFQQLVKLHLSSKSKLPTSSIRPAPLQSHGGLSSFETKRFFSTPGDSGFPVFNIQDEEDFKKRVIDSSSPVIVQFTAS